MVPAVIYGKLRSWHILHEAGLDASIRVGGLDVMKPIRTLCGRTLPDGPDVIGPLGSLPLDEKSCETCLRFAAKRGWRTP